MATKLAVIRINPEVTHKYGQELSGRCHKCNSRFVWPRTLGKLYEMNCPFCGVPLRQTTHLFKGDTYRLERQKEK